MDKTHYGETQADGRIAVYWLIDEIWKRVGWLMPTQGTVNAADNC